jgi:glutamate racemase
MRVGGAREEADGNSPRPPVIASPPLQPGAGRGRPAASPMPLLGPSVMPRLLRVPTILVFDSGLGGLTVFREIAHSRPDARLIYAADDALFPYGQVEETRLVARVLAVVDALIAEHRPDLAVIACNTASTLVLPALRARFDVPFVGTVPAIKPACASSVTGRVSVLGTEATVRREYTQALIRQYGGDCRVTLVGSPRLAGFAEAELSGSPADDEAIRAEMLPCFVDDGARTDTIVLACTHYPLLTARLERLAPWPVRFIDPAPAIARRVVDLVGGAKTGAPAVSPLALFTSGRAPSPPLVTALAAFGLAVHAPPASLPANSALPPI